MSYENRRREKNTHKDNKFQTEMSLLRNSKEEAMNVQNPTIYFL